MIKDFEVKKLTRNDVFNKYLFLKYEGTEGLTPYATKEIEKSLPKFKGKTKMEILIRGTITFNKDYDKLFTFLDKEYNIDENITNKQQYEGFEEAVDDIFKFDAFTKGTTPIWYSQVEGEYINYANLQHAYIEIELT